MSFKNLTHKSLIVIIMVDDDTNGLLFMVHGYWTLVLLIVDTWLNLEPLVVEIHLYIAIALDLLLGEYTYQAVMPSVDALIPDCLVHIRRYGQQVHSLKG